MATNIYSNQWLDQVFEKHNRNYGAYVLRKNADDYTLTGLAVAIAIVAVVFIIPVIGNIFSGHAITHKPIFEATTFAVIDAPEIIPPAEKINIASTPAAAPKSTNDMIKPLIVSKEEPIDTTDHSELNNPDPNKLHTLVNGKGNPNDTDTGLAIGNHNEIVSSVDTNIYKGSIEIMPQFPGGENAMLNFLISHLKYPRNLIEDNITGTVYLSFIVNKDGAVTGIEVLRGVREIKDFENEAKRVVAMMPKWKAGRQNGQNVSVYFTLPVRFSLK